MEDLKEGKDSHIIPMTSVRSGKETAVSVDVVYYTDQIVNVIFIGLPDTKDWILVDAGMPGSAGTLLEIAEKRFGKDNPPAAILLTHGHFDHVGSLVKLLERWVSVPVFAHPDEFPYLTGKMDYPKPDPSVEGGLLAKISGIYPHKAIDVAPVLHMLPSDGSIPGLKEWHWIHTPGHSPGHVSFYRQRDKLLIAGDAFVTVRQDSLYKVLFQKKEICGPPVYLTTDWIAARDSVRELAALEPATAITGHGQHVEGAELQQGLALLAQDFDTVALPKYGKYVTSEGTDKR
jgi:glyoxylase-like metal-dependent hydrolase (beta-lactamase superfamily II)